MALLQILVSFTIQSVEIILELGYLIKQNKTSTYCSASNASLHLTAETFSKHRNISCNGSTQD
jgi:hypothetical protein